jgi:hypothetical protein
VFDSDIMVDLLVGCGVTVGKGNSNTCPALVGAGFFRLALVRHDLSRGAVFASSSGCAWPTAVIPTVDWLAIHLWSEMLSL